MVELLRFGHYVDGTFTEPAAAMIDSEDPARGVPWAQISRGDAQTADSALRSARRAFEAPSWAGLGARERADLLETLASAIAARWPDLLDAEISDNGKRIVEVRAQFAALPVWFRAAAAQARELKDTSLTLGMPGVSADQTHLPYGPIVAITPWNSPLMILSWKLAPALAAGNTVVAKPSEHASVSTLLFADLLHEAGLPPGVFNVVTGFGAEVGAALVAHEETRFVSFTGSETGGARVAAAAAAHVVPTVLELGGKSPQIVFADADLESAVYGIASGVFLSNGQSCIAGSRLIVENAIKQPLLERLIGRVSRLRMGDPREPATEIGPLANRAHADKVRAMIARAKVEGAECVLDGVAAAHGQGACFVGPTIFDRVTPQMEIWRDEVFGPVLAVASFADAETALRLAQDTRYGLAAGVWSLDLHRARRFAEQLQVGTIYINHYRSVDPNAPIGGIGRSGYGRELGPEAVRGFLQTRTVWTGDAPISDPFPA
ncbi:MAG: aldehyde dehydrogenase family protein [Pseudomonadota bacterium]